MKPEFINFGVMKPYRITAVKYYNTLPFIYGLTKSGKLTDYDLSLDVPSECARKLIAGEADLGLIPVGALPGIQNYKIISDLCIGAIGDVQSVILLTDSELTSLKKIYLDTDSLTSVNLAKVLAKRLWKIEVQWESSANFTQPLQPGEAMVAIGDKTFNLRPKFNSCYDLASEWIRLIGLPFVFAVWVAAQPIPQTFINNFNEALQWGVEHKKESMTLASNLVISEAELLEYLENAIHYPLDESKRKGLELFLSML